MDVMAVLDELRSAVGRDARSHATIARAAGIHPKTFSPFVNGKTGLSIDGIERLADVLGFALTLTPKAPPNPRRK